MKTRTLTRLRVGRIRYLNTLPFYYGLNQAEWTLGTPAEINRKMHAGEIDIAPISSLEYLNHQKDYLVFPELCIGSRDFSGSVLLLSKERVEGLDRAVISLSKDSLSAAALLKILLKFKFGFQNQFRTDPSNPETMLRTAPACLVIGDEALFFRPKEFLYKNDLSEIWWHWTSLPFCFSVWAVRRDFYGEHKEEVADFYRQLKAALKRNLGDLEKLLREEIRVTITDERFPTIYGYLFNLSYGLDAEMQRGLGRFFEYAHQMGISPASDELEFIKA